MTPKRIQLSRKKGFELPLNTRSVGRPSKFGNGFIIGELTRAQAVENHRAATVKKLRKDPDYLEELRGMNLARWCAPGIECHADTLIALANRPRRS